MKKLLYFFIILISVFLGVLVGDAMVDASTALRPRDIIFCRVGIPFLFGLAGVLFTLYIDKQ